MTQGGGGRVFLVKRKICTFWQRGMCNKGEVCEFAHGAHELGAPVAGSPFNQQVNFQNGGQKGGANADAVSMGGMMNPLSQMQHPTAPQGFKKTKLCIHFA